MIGGAGSAKGITTGSGGGKQAKKGGFPAGGGPGKGHRRELRNVDIGGGSGCKPLEVRIAGSSGFVA